MLCSIKEFKEALSLLISLLNEQNYKKKNLDTDIVAGVVENIQLFLENLSDAIKDFDDYTKLIKYLEDMELNEKKLLPLNGYLGKILDSIQLLKPNTSRHKNAKYYFLRSLKRTGHHYLYNEISDEDKLKLFTEIIECAALYIILEVSSLAYSNDANPISSLRNSMGDRLPEEYFSELLAGWHIEDIFIKQLKDKGLKVVQSGVDTNRKILFKKMKGMGEEDITLNYNNKTYKIELQRVGKATFKDFYKTALKKHKIKNNDSIIILWFGDKPKGIAKSNKFLYNKICFIKNSDINNKQNNLVQYTSMQILLSKKYIKDNSINNWDSFKSKNGNDIIKFIQ